MIRVVVFLLACAAAATGLSWLADRPGRLLINWEGYEIQATVFHAIVALALLILVAIVLWSILRGAWNMPAGVGKFFHRRREKRGLEALSSGLIAIGAGDKSLATRYAVQARKSLPNEPLTHVLRAQAAQLSGDRATARRIFEAMLSSPETEPLGLRGLFLEAEREGEQEAARQFAERALALNPKLPWPVHSLFDLQCKTQDWAGALETLGVARKHSHIEKAEADRKRAVLMTAQAQECETSDPERAMKLASEAHDLAHDLVPATAIAGRLQAARGNVQKASKILQRGWRKGPHPDIAIAYAYARIGDSPKDRLARVRQLAALSPNSIESPIAVATTAVEARDFESARKALEPLLENRLTQRVCTLMAKIESEDGGNAGAVREWLARAVNAPRDPAWTADGVIADDWAPVSPVTGALDAFQWRVPLEAAHPRDSAILHDKIEELVKLGARPEVSAAAATVAATATSNQDAAPVSRAKSEPPSAPVRDAEDVEIVAEAKPAPTAARPEQKATAASAPVAKPTEVAPKTETVARAAETKPSGSNTRIAPADEAVATEAQAKAVPAKDTSAAPVTASVGTKPNVKEPETVAAAAAPSATASSAASAAPDSTKSTAMPVRVAPPLAATREQATVNMRTQPSTPQAPNVFVSPRAPDDPGTDSPDGSARGKSGGTVQSRFGSR